MSSRAVLELFLIGLALAVSPLTTLGQSCSFNTVPQGRVCSKEGARCSPPSLGGGNVGLTPATLSAGVATSTITVIPFNGFTGKVDFACTISGMGHPAPSCATPAPATVTGPSSATSLLTVSVSSSTADAEFTVTVNAVDAHGRPPDNGACLRSGCSDTCGVPGDPPRGELAAGCRSLRLGTLRFLPFPPPFRPVRPKIRQQLQVLRHLGLLEFLGSGSYRLSGAR